MQTKFSDGSIPVRVMNPSEIRHSCDHNCEGDNSGCLLVIIGILFIMLAGANSRLERIGDYLEAQHKASVQEVVDDVQQD